MPAVSRRAERAPHTGGKTRRRGEALEEALLEAAWHELETAGYRAMTMDAVADRAGTSRAVLYRRWRNKAELVIAAVRHHAPMLSGEVPDTGSLRGDVLALLQRSSDRLTERGPELTYGLLADYFGNPDIFAELHGQVVQIGASVMATILKRAVDRGEARDDIPPMVATLPTDLFRHQVVVARTPPTREVIVQIVDDVFLPLVRPERDHDLD